MSRIVFVLLAFALINVVIADEIGEKLAKINNEGLPESVLYEAAGINVNARTIGLNKAELAKALEDPVVQAAATKAALEYAIKTAEINPPQPTAYRGGESSYCDNSWMTWLPFMDCDNSDPVEDKTEKNTVRETNSKCYNSPN